MLISLVLNVALAQESESLDAHGFSLAPNDGDALDYLSLWRTEEQKPGAIGVNGLFEYAERPLVLVSRDYTGAETRKVLVDNLLGLNIGASYAPHPRFAVALSAPVFFTSAYTDPSGELVVGGPTFGDLRLATPVGILLPDEDDEGGMTLSAIPFIDVPTGNNARNLGNAGFGGGGMVAIGMQSEIMTLDANVGAQFTPEIDYENLRGGPKLIAGLGLGVMVSETIAIRGESVYRPNLRPNQVPGTESPGEFLVSARGRYERGISWTGGLALPFTRGASAAFFRVFGGAGFTWGKPIDPDTDLDGLRDSVDACPTEAETVNAWKDEDGCPDKLARVTIEVVDEDGNIMRNALVTLGGKEYRTDANGKVVVADLMPKTTLDGSVSQEYYYDSSIPTMQLVEGDQAAKIVLDYREAKVQVKTYMQDGTPINAMVTFQGPFQKDPSFVGVDGDEVFDVRPGDWRVLVSADSFATERRELHLEPGEQSLIVIEIPMKPAKTRMVAKEIQILEQVFFDFDKDTIQPQSFELLTEVANILIQHQEIKLLEVQGHTDSKGNDAYNQDLSQRRVESVRRFLMEQGVDGGRLQAKGYGETMPIADNKTNAGRALNRRVQFMILQQEQVIIEVDPNAAPEGAQPVESDVIVAPPPTTP